MYKTMIQNMNYYKHVQGTQNGYEKNSRINKKLNEIIKFQDMKIEFNKKNFLLKFNMVTIVLSNEIWPFIQGLSFL